MTVKRTVEQQRRYDRDRAARLMRTYGITIAEYDEILEVQGGSCYICRRAKGISKALQVDHDHALEAQGLPMRATVRGLLCGRDNNRLGWYEAKAGRIEDYLSDPPAKAVIL
jgi:hypothetical protein